MRKDLASFAAKPRFTGQNKAGKRMNALLLRVLLFVSNAPFALSNAVSSHISNSTLLKKIVKGFCR